MACDMRPRRHDLSNKNSVVPSSSTLFSTGGTNRDVNLENSNMFPSNVGSSIWLRIEASKKLSRELLQERWERLETCWANDVWMGWGVFDVSSWSSCWLFLTPNPPSDAGFSGESENTLMSRPLNSLSTSLRKRSSSSSWVQLVWMKFCSLHIWWYTRRSVRFHEDWTTEEGPGRLSLCMLWAETIWYCGASTEGIRVVLHPID